MASSYTIQINEYQRLMLLAALNSVAKSGVSLPELPDTGNGGLFDSMGPISDELDMFARMLGTLPEDEAESPGVLHGFCL